MRKSDYLSVAVRNRLDATKYPRLSLECNSQIVYITINVFFIIGGRKEWTLYGSFLQNLEIGQKFKN